jgi:hypothetical protein
MKKVYRTANGKSINMDAIIAQNENVIAVGNMKVNARGDQLGPGGKIEIPKDKVMSEYYKLNTPVAVDNPPQPRPQQVAKVLEDDWIESVAKQSEVETPQNESKSSLRGSLADSVAKTLTSEKETKKTGPTRI